MFFDGLVGCDVGVGNMFYLDMGDFVDCVWQVMFFVFGGYCVGIYGYGFLFLCIQLCCIDCLYVLLLELQDLIIDVYFEVLLVGVVLWIIVLCIVFVVDDCVDVLWFVEVGLCWVVEGFCWQGQIIFGDSIEELIVVFDIYLGILEEVVELFVVDIIFVCVIEVVFQVYLVDVLYEYVLCLIVFFVDEVVFVFGYVFIQIFDWNFIFKENV